MIAAKGLLVVLLFEHRYVYGDWGDKWTICRCGFQPPEPPRNASAEHRVHVADMLLASDAMAQIKAEATACELRDWADELDKPPYDLWDRAAIPRLRAHAAGLSKEQHNQPDATQNP